jgi:hypothetical protein
MTKLTSEDRSWLATALGPVAGPRLVALYDMLHETTASDADGPLFPKLRATAMTAGGLTLSGSTVSAGDMTAGSGFTGTGTVIEHAVTRVNDLIKTEIMITLTGMNGGGTANDIIGKDAQANCHFGQITAAVNGAIFAGEMRCLVVPAGGNIDIDLSAATAATGAEDADVTALAGYAQLLNAGNWAVNTFKGLTALPAANTYLYLSNGVATAATYTGGVFAITLWGK